MRAVSRGPIRCAKENMPGTANLFGTARCSTRRPPDACPYKHAAIRSMAVPGIVAWPCPESWHDGDGCPAAAFWWGRWDGAYPWGGGRADGTGRAHGAEGGPTRRCGQRATTPA